MRIITWNVNSLRARLERVLGAIERHGPDVLCLQETKTADDGFPLEAFQVRGYHAVRYGQRAYNGVAILAREKPSDVARGFPGDPAADQARVVSATIGGLHIINAYAVNGQEVGSPAFQTKLAWYGSLRDWIADQNRPNEPVLLVGDMNITPDDRDVHDPERWRERILCSTPERETLQGMVDWGLRDLLREKTEEAGIHTWWDYRMGAFARGWGLRIDLALGTEPVADRLVDVTVDREERKQGDWESKPSDHAPVIIDLDD